MTIQRFDTNPFTQELLLKTPHKQVLLSAHTDAKNPNTDHTRLTTYTRLTDQEFLDQFVAHITHNLSLGSAASKVLHLVCWYSQEHVNPVGGEQLVPIDQHTLAQYNAVYPFSSFSPATLRRGVSELIDTELLARARYAGLYYLNPMLVFTADRMTLMHIIRRAQPSAAHASRGVVGEEMAEPVAQQTA